MNRVCDVLLRLFGVLAGRRAWVCGFEGLTSNGVEPAGGTEAVKGRGVVGGDVSCGLLGWWDLRSRTMRSGSAAVREGRGTTYLAEINISRGIARGVRLLKSRNRFGDIGGGAVVVPDFP